MKKVLLSMLAVMAFVFTGCDDDDDNELKSASFVVHANDLKGDIPSGADVVLDASVNYKLTGALIVEGGASLTIPAGTVIEATTPTTDNLHVRYIAVEQGGLIYVNGSATAPVIMTAENKEPSSWGGLVICGNAPTNKGISAAAEVSELAYGGTNVDDNSGVIKFLRIEYSGYKYSEKKEFNGLSMFGVGAGTLVDYVVSYKGGDDGFEFFGGTVNASHLVSVDSEDDGIDFADGWAGTGDMWYILNAAKSSIEGSNNGDDGAADNPMTNATLKNITAYKSGEKPYYFKEGAGMHNVTNIVIGGLKADKGQPYFYADDVSKDASVHQRIAAGDIAIAGVKFIDRGQGNTIDAVEGLTIVIDDAATGAGNGIEKPSWMPDALNNIDGNTTVIN